MLTAAVLLPGSLAAGCTLSDGTAPARQRTAAPADNPDLSLLDDAVEVNASLIEVYERTIERHPDLERTLRPLLRSHRAHASAFGDAAPAGADRRSRGPSGRGPRVPPRAAAALRNLSDHESENERGCQMRARRAASGEFARLLASIAACSAQHRWVLERAAVS